MSRPSSAIQIVRPPPLTAQEAAAGAAATLKAQPSSGGLNVNAATFGVAPSSAGVTAALSPEKRTGELCVLLSVLKQADERWDDTAVV
jgi:hypothetical protein